MLGLLVAATRFHKPYMSCWSIGGTYMRRSRLKLLLLFMNVKTCWKRGSTSREVGQTSRVVGIVVWLRVGVLSVVRLLIDNVPVYSLRLRLRLQLLPLLRQCRHRITCWRQTIAMWKLGSGRAGVLRLRLKMLPVGWLLVGICVVLIK